MSRPPSVYQFGMHFDAAAGGADRYFNGLVGGLRDIGAQCTAFAFGATSRSDNVALGTVDIPLFKRLKAIRAAGKKALQDRDGVIATHFALYATALQPSLGRKAHVVHFHGPWATESAREGESKLAVIAKRLVEQTVYQTAGRLIVLSTAFHDVLVNEYGIPSQRISIIPGGVETQNFTPGDRTAAREKFGWPQDSKVVLCVRRLVHRMGLANLIEAFKAVPQPNLILVIAGRGPLESELRAQAAKAGLGNRVRFTGFVPDHDLPMLYTAADFSIVPSETLEGFGLTTLESMACGTPVLVTPVGGLPETVAGLDRSLILSGNDVAAITAGLERGLTQALPTSAQCRTYIEETFAWPKIASRVLSVYREVAA
jgi:glycosyltransferase involved in cell wall biosynthesis